jgi:hypothetical protein
MALMEKPEDYRRYAAECLQLARAYQNQSKAAVLLLEMAERWRDLAQRAEGREAISEPRK